MADDILVKYKTDLSEANQNLDNYEAKLRSTGQTGTNAFKGIESQAKDSSQKIVESLNPISQALKGIAEGALAAFAVEKLKQFISVSIDAFAKVEQSSRGLQFAVTKVIGGTTDQLKMLQAQAKQLSATSFFTNEQITRAQLMAANFGLNAEQIKKLIPQLLNLAATPTFNNDLVAATEATIQALDGRGFALKRVGIELKTGSSLTEKFNEVTEKLTKLNGEAADALDTTAGKIKDEQKAIEELEVEVGQKAAPVFLKFKKAILESASDGLDGLKQFYQAAKALFDKNKSIILNPFNIFRKGTTDAEDEANAKAKFEEDVNLAKQEFKNLSEAELKQKIETNTILAQIQKNKPDEQGQTLAALEAQKELLAELINKKKEEAKANEVIAIQNEDISKKTIEQLNEEIEKLKARDGASNIDIRSEITRREDQIKVVEKLIAKELTARKAASEKLKDFARTDAEQALAETQTDSLVKIEQEKQNKINERNVLFKEGLKTKEDEENLRTDILAINQFYDAKILEEKEKLAKKLKELNDKNAKEDLKDTIDALTIGGELQKQKIIQEFEDKKDFSQKAQKKLALDLSNIDTDTKNKAVDETKKAALDESQAEVSAAKTTTEGLKKEVDKQIEDQKLKREAIIQGFEIEKQFQDEIFSFANKDIQAQIDSLDARNQLILDGFDAEAAALEKKNERGAISDRAYQKQKDDLEKRRADSQKKFAAEEKKLKNEQAQNDWRKSIFDIITSTAVAIMSAAKNPFLIPFITALGALELANVLSHPPPKFFKGTKYVQRGHNKPGIDTVPAYLTEGERILEVEKNKRYWDIYESIDNNKFHELINKKYVVPIIIDFQKRQEENRRKENANQIGQSIFASYNGLTAHEMRRIANRGTSINNVREIGQAVGDAIDTRLPKQKNSW